MLRQYRPHHFIKTVASSATPEFLSEEVGFRLYGFQLIAEKAFNTPNSGNVVVQVDGEDVKLLEPGDEWTWPMPAWEAGFLDPKRFKIKVAADGDGVRCLSGVLI